MQVAKELIKAGSEELLLSEDLKWLEAYPLNGSDMYANMAFRAGFIPNQEYLLAAMAASYYEYETITIEGKKKCIDD